MIFYKRQLEFVTALFLLLFGIWFSNPLWKIFEMSSIYHLMEQIAPETVWGYMMILVGATQMGFLFTKFLLVRAIISVFVIMVLLVITIMFFVSDYRGGLAIATFVYTICAHLSYNELLWQMKRAKNVG